MKKPIIGDKLEINRLDDGRFSVFHKYTKKTYVLGKSEFAVLESLDGIRDICDIAEENGYLEDEVSRLIGIYDKLGLLSGSEVKMKKSILRISLGMINPNKFLKTNGICVKVISSILLYLTIPLLIVGILLNVKDLSMFYDLLMMFQTPIALVIIPITYIITLLHELGHVVIAKRYHASVPELGVVLYWFMPAAYVNLSSISLVKSRHKRILTYCGGIIMNTFLISIALLVRFLIPVEYKYFFTWFVLDSLLNIVFNLLIFLKFDGYLILKELVNENYLRERAFEYIKKSLKRYITFSKDTKITIQKVSDFGEVSDLRKGLYVSYAFFSFLYIPFLVLSLAIAVISAII